MPESHKKNPWHSHLCTFSNRIQSAPGIEGIQLLQDGLHRRIVVNTVMKLADRYFLTSWWNVRDLVVVVKRKFYFFSRYLTRFL